MPKLSDFSSGAGYPDRALDFLVKGPTPAEVDAWLLDENNVAAFVTMVQGPHFDGALNAPTALGSMFGSADVAESILTNTRIVQRINDATAWANIQSELAWINIADNETTMNVIVATDANVSGIAASPTAMQVFDANDRALRQLICAPAGLVYTDYVDIDALAANSAGMTAVAASSVAMTAVIASPTALAAVIASPTALAAVAASQTSIDAIAASTTAMTSIRNSTVAMQALRDSPLALEAESAALEWGAYHPIGAASNQVSIIIDFRWNALANTNPTFLRTLYPGGGEISDAAWISETFQPVGYAFSNVEARSSGNTNTRVRYVRYIPTTIPNPA